MAGGSLIFSLRLFCLTDGQMGGGRGWVASGAGLAYWMFVRPRASRERRLTELRQEGKMCMHA